MARLKTVTMRNLNCPPGGFTSGGTYRIDNIAPDKVTVVNDQNELQTMGKSWFKEFDGE